MVESSARQSVVYPFDEWKNAVKLDSRTFNSITSHFKDDDKSIKNKVGRKKIIINVDDYLAVVRKRRTLSDNIIAKELSISRSTIYKFRTNIDNIGIIARAQDIIEEVSNLEYAKVSYEVFTNIPIIIEWDDMIKKRMVSNKYRKGLIRSLYNICKYLKVHPRKLTLEDGSKLNQKIKELYYNDEPRPRGLSYQHTREAIRSFFMLIHRLSGEYLTYEGITKENVKGYGRYSKMKVPIDVRHRFEKELEGLADNDDDYWELIGCAKFMYYTGTRINATLSFNFRTHNYNLEKDMWMLEVLDKGERRNGRLKWQKILVGQSLEDFKEYASKRFNIEIDDLESELPLKTDHLFPSYTDKNVDMMRRKYRDAFTKAGLQYQDYPPCHIWRHTFAQDFLSATNWNFELCGSVGGWKSTKILKENYGEMGIDPMIDGLKEAMGLPVKKETKELRW